MAHAMILGIDASNIRAGGGVTHLVELLRSARPDAYGFTLVIVWGGAETLGKLDPKPWLHKVHEHLLDRALPYRIFWQRYRLRELAVKSGCDLLFVPGGSDASDFKPMVTMNQNLLPFEWRELLYFGWSLMTLKFATLRFTQAATFRRAAGVIFLSRYARDAVARVVGPQMHQGAIVAHGVSRRFHLSPRPIRRVEDCSEMQPLRLIYVSIIEVYKHPWHVAEAVARLRAEGFPIVLDLVGPAGSGIGRLQATLRKVDASGKVIHYHGAIRYEDLHALYTAADIAICASSCETFGQTLTEAMAAGLPIACSNRSAMPEILADAGDYFDPLRAEDIAAALRRLILAPERRAKMAAQAYARAQGYSWETCANSTFEFLARHCR